MSENLLLALQITGVGMGLVFGAIGLLWLMMVVLVRLTAERVAPPAPELTPAPVPEDDVKRQAALAAVAIALAQAQQRPAPRFSPPPTSSVSAWQGVMRGRQLKQRGRTR